MPGRQRRKIIPALPDNPGTVRYRILALKGKANALAQTGDYRQAKQTLDAAMTLANRYNIKDARLAIMGCYKYLYTLKEIKKPLPRLSLGCLPLKIPSYRIR